MRILLDTNILLRLTQFSNPDRQAVETALSALCQAGFVLCLVPQNLYEYWSVVTRPLEVNGLGMDTAAAKLAMDRMLEEFVLLRDERGIFNRWLVLVDDHDVKGKPAHDARLVAAMQRHGVDRLLTFNLSDFLRFSKITAHSPYDVAAGRLPV